MTSTIDNFDDGDVSDWHAFNDPASQLTEHRISTSRAQSGTMSFKLTYAVAAGGYVGVEKIFTAPASWSGYGGLDVWVYGEATNHPFKVQVYDAGGERWETSFVVDFSGWREISLPFTSFALSAWQPAGVVANRVFDLAGVRGMALLPAPGASSGSVYLDSLGLGNGSTTAAAPAAPAPAPAPASQSTGSLVPLYSFPTSPAWTSLINAKLAHPSVPVMAVVNPNNGPGTAVSATYVNGIARLRAAGIKVIGYVHTSYAGRAATAVQADIDLWRSMYPGVSGIFFDEQSSTVGYEGYYTNLTTYAKSHGFDYTIGNPGSDSKPSYVGTVDMMLVYESAGFPTTDRLAGWHASYDRRNFGIIPYNCGWSDPTMVAAYKNEVGFIYLQSDNLPNPWDTVPTYLETLFSQLQ